MPNASPFTRAELQDIADVYATAVVQPCLDNLAYIKRTHPDNARFLRAAESMLSRHVEYVEGLTKLAAQAPERRSRAKSAWTIGTPNG